MAITDIITLAKSNLKKSNKKISFLQKILNRPDTVGAIGNYIPFLSNFILHSYIFRFIAEKLLGLDRNAPMPKFTGRKFKKFVNAINFNEDRTNIFYFSGCSVDHYDYEVGISALKVLDILFKTSVNAGPSPKPLYSEILNQKTASDKSIGIPIAI